MKKSKKVSNNEERTPMNFTNNDDIDKQSNTQCNKEKNEKPTTSTVIRYTINLIAILAVIFSIICYISTLVGCNGTSTICLRDFDQSKIKTIALILLLSAFLCSFNLVLYLFGYISYYIPLIHLLIFLYLCLYYDRGSDLKSHGAYNRVYLIVIMIPCFIFQCCLLLLKKMFSMSKLYTTIFVTIMIVIIKFYMSYKFNNSCVHWNNGLKNSKLDVNYPVCKIRQPKVCWMNIMDNIFDLSYWFGMNCEKFSFASKKFLFDKSNLLANETI